METMCRYVENDVDNEHREQLYGSRKHLEDVCETKEFHSIHRSDLRYYSGAVGGSDGDQSLTDTSDSSTCSLSPSYQGMISQPGGHSSLISGHRLSSRTLQQRVQQHVTPQGSSSKKKKVKSTYKHVPHCEKAPHLVAKRNARERRRVMAVNNAFTRLRKHVPCENRNKRISKVKTLKIAIDYIYYLQDLIDEHDHQSLIQQQLRKQMSSLASSTTYPASAGHSLPAHSAQHGSSLRAPPAEEQRQTPADVPPFYANMYAASHLTAPQTCRETEDHDPQEMHAGNQYGKDNACMYNSNYVSK